MPEKMTPTEWAERQRTPGRFDSIEPLPAYLAQRLPALLPKSAVLPTPAMRDPSPVLLWFSQLGERRTALAVALWDEVDPDGQQQESPTCP